MANSPVMAMGINQMWGFSPAIDLQDRSNVNGFTKAELLPFKPATATKATGYHILLCGAADIRHILLTLSRASRWPKRELHFYILEESVHTLARHLLFLMIALEPSFSPRARMELWFELYANAMIQEKTQSTLVELCKSILRLFVSDDGPLAAYIDLDHVKYKDRDEIEKVVKWWRTGDVYDMVTLRDTRLRAYTATRYDSRANLYDWDYHMEGIQQVAHILHLRHYKRWRDSGQAFELRDCEYKMPNRTLASYREARQRGLPVMVRGYWGDILVSPFIAFGVASEAKILFEVRQEQQVKNSVLVSEWNMRALFHELYHATRYPLPLSNFDDSGTLLATGDDDVPEPAAPVVAASSSTPATAAAAAATTVTPPAKSSTETKTPAKTGTPTTSGAATPASSSSGAVLDTSSWPSFRIHILTDELKKMRDRSRYDKLFNRVFLSQFHAQHASSDINSMLSDDCCITIETTRYVPLKEESKNAYAAKICDMAVRQATWQCASSSNSGIDHAAISFFYKPSHDNLCDYVPPPLPAAATPATAAATPTATVSPATAVATA